MTKMMLAVVTLLGVALPALGQDRRLELFKPNHCGPYVNHQGVCEAPVQTPPPAAKTAAPVADPNRPAFDANDEQAKLNKEYPITVPLINGDKTILGMLRLKLNKQDAADPKKISAEGMVEFARPVPDGRGGSRLERVVAKVKTDDALAKSTRGRDLGVVDYAAIIMKGVAMTEASFGGDPKKSPAVVSVSMGQISPALIDKDGRIYTDLVNISIDDQNLIFTPYTPPVAKK